MMRSGLSIPHIFRMCSKGKHSKLSPAKSLAYTGFSSSRHGILFTLRGLKWRWMREGAQALTPCLPRSTGLSGSQLWKCRCFQEKAAIQRICCDVKGFFQRKGGEGCTGKVCELAQCCLLNSPGWKPIASIQYLLTQYFTSLLLLQIQRIFNHQRIQYLHQTLHIPV